MVSKLGHYSPPDIAVSFDIRDSDTDMTECIGSLGRWTMVIIRYGEFNEFKKSPQIILVSCELLAGLISGVITTILCMFQVVMIKTDLCI